MKSKVGILGAGSIARQMARTLAGMETAEAYAVGARDIDRAKSFAQEFGIGKAYGCYEDLLADPEVQLIYVATPHSHHAAQMKMCIEAGKHVLCEKAFTVTAGEAKEVLRLARQKGVLVAEAIWPRYMPMARTLRELCESDRLGKISALQGSLGYPVYHKERIRRPELAGGALLDIGIYPLTFAAIAFGDEVSAVSSSALFSDTGVDLQESMTLSYPDGRLAVLHATVIGITDRAGRILGDKGYAVVDNINNFECIRIYDNSHKLIEHIARPAQITGFEYEVQAAVDAIEAGELECPQMTHAQIIGMMERMDQMRHSWGFTYPGEQL